MSYTRKALTGSLLIFIGLFVGGTLNYITRIVFSRTYSPSDFGLISAITTLMLLFILLQNLGLNFTIAKFIPEFNVKKKKSKIKSTIIGSLIIQVTMTIIIVAIIYFISPFLAEHYFKTEISGPLLRLMSFSLIFYALTDTISYSFLGLQKNKIYSGVEPVKNALFLALFLIFYIKIKSLYAIVYAFILSPLISICIFLPIFLKESDFLKHPAKIEFKVFKRLLKFGIPVMVTQLSYQVISYLDLLILTFFAPLEIVGVYSVALNTAIVLLFLTRAINLVIYPMSSEIWARKKYDLLADGIRRLRRYVLIVALPIIMGLFTFSQYFLRIVFGEEYVLGSAALRILLLGTLLYILAQVNLSVLSGVGKPESSARVVAIAAAVNFIANIILIPKYGMIGAAIGTGISYLTGLVLSSHYTKKIIKVKESFNMTSKIGLSGVVFVLIINLLRRIFTMPPFLEMIILLFIGAMVYISLLFFLKVISMKDIKQLTAT